MRAYVQAFINIALRRAGPEDLPDSLFLLMLTLALYMIVQIPLALIAFGPTRLFFNTVIVSLLMLLMGLWILLRLLGFRQRYRQTLTALLGTGVMLGILSLPISVWRNFMADSDAGAGMPSLLLFIITLWSITIVGHILSRALSRPYGIGLLLSVGYFFLELSVYREMMVRSLGA